MSKKVTCEFTRHPGSVFVTPTSIPQAAEIQQNAPDWTGVAKAIIADTPLTPTPKPRQRVLPQDTPQECVTDDPRKDFVEGAAENMRVYRISHLGEKDKLIYEASPSEDDDAIFARAQQYANSNGYIVRVVRHDPHLIQKFQPAVWRESADMPPIVDADAPPAVKLEGLGSYTIAKGCMFFDDRPLQNGRFKRRHKGNVIAWLNKVKGEGFYLNIVRKDLLTLLKPIPRSVTDLGDAIDWVSYHCEWKDTDPSNETLMDKEGSRKSQRTYHNQPAAFEWDAINRWKFGK